MKKLILVLAVVILAGCSTIDNKSSIVQTTTGVEFDANHMVEMSMEKDGIKYHYNSQSPSLLSRIMSAITLGAVSTSR